MNKTVLIVGAGRIGTAVKNLLSPLYNTAQYDPILIPSNGISLEQYVDNVSPDAIIACTPASENLKIATVCAQKNVAYFDLTESFAVRDGIEEMLTRIPVTVPFMPQCGLAPGMVNMIACSYAKKLHGVESVHIRVGALPQAPNNLLGYDVTWSADGLVNEYINQSEVLHNSTIYKQESCEALEPATVEGKAFVAALTSGGIGNSLKYFQSIGVSDANYKTLRWPGHWELIQFLKSDLQLAKHKEAFIKIFDDSLTNNLPDMIAIKIAVQSKTTITEYEKIIYPTADLTAIQSSTASGVCAVIDSYLQGHIPLAGMVSHDQVDLSMLANSIFIKVYDI